MATALLVRESQIFWKGLYKVEKERLSDRNGKSKRSIFLECFSYFFTPYDTVNGYLREGAVFHDLDEVCFSFLVLQKNSQNSDGKFTVAMVYFKKENGCLQNPHTLSEQGEYL